MLYNTFGSTRTFRYPLLVRLKKQMYICFFKRTATTGGVSWTNRRERQFTLHYSGRLATTPPPVDVLRNDALVLEEMRMMLGVRIWAAAAAGLGAVCVYISHRNTNVESVYTISLTGLSTIAFGWQLLCLLCSAICSTSSTYVNCRS